MNEIETINLEMYNLAENAMSRLYRQKLGKSPLGLRWKSEMDYWWNRLSLEVRHEKIRCAREELLTAFGV